MVHNIAHQWRQPLNALAIIVSNIKDDYDYGELDGERLDQAISRVRHLLEQMSNTIDDFRDFFRPDREPIGFDVAAAVEEALFVMEASLHINRISLDKRMQPGLLTFGHANQFSQAVLNLIANAKEALQLAKVIPARIAVEVVRDGDQAVLTVRDNAGGIPADVLPRVFEPYFTTKEQGSGIGLYMTKMIIERNLHGTITASNDGSGALITVRVPLQPEQ
jgi:signal transduction histidine kinase